MGYISLDLMPAFYAGQLGLSFGDAYYFDPGYREKVDAAKHTFLHDIIGPDDYPIPPSSHSIFVQPVDLVMATQGAEWRFPDDSTLESLGAPWSSLEPDDVALIPAEDAANHPVLDRILSQYHELAALYDDADIFGIRSGIMNIHTPYTTAHQLCGEELFVIMALDPDGARVIFDKIWEIYRAIFARLERETGAHPKRLFLGDCSACMLSPQMYQEQLLPLYHMITRGFDSVGYHSCGPSSKLLEHIGCIPTLDTLQLGPGTDLASACELSVSVSPLIEPSILCDSDCDAVREKLRHYVDPVVCERRGPLCAWSLDGQTRPENLRLLYEAGW